MVVSERKLAVTAEVLRSEGAKVFTAAFDVTNGAASAAAITRVEEECGAIDTPGE
jgi:NADP-dependent 3-hydroxy acid dehydrogenase YdfG